MNTNQKDGRPPKRPRRVQKEFDQIPFTEKIGFWVNRFVFQLMGSGGLVVPVVMLVAASAAFLWLNSGGEKPKSNADVDQSRSIAALLNENIELQNESTKEVVTRLVNLSKRIKLANELLEHPQADASSNSEADLIQMECFAATAINNFLEDLPRAKNREIELERLINKNAASNSTRHSAKAAVGKLTLSLLDHAENPNDKSYQILEQTLGDAITKVDKCLLEYPGTPLRWFLLKFQIIAYDEKLSDSEGRELRRKAGGLLKACETPALATMGCEVFDRSVFGDVSFREIWESLEYVEPKNLKKTIDFITLAAENPDVSSQYFIESFALIERLKQCDCEREAQIGLERINMRLSDIQNESKRQLIKNEIDNVEKRARLVGTHLDLDIQDDDGRAVLSQDKIQLQPTIVVFYKSDDKKMIDATVPIIDLLADLRVDTLSIFVDLSEDFRGPENLFATLDKRRTIQVGKTNCEALFAQIPVINLPYVVILDQKQIVRSANVLPDKIRRILNAL